MKVIVIKYPQPFKYRSRYTSFESLRHILLKALIFWIPKASPDYDDKVEKILYWYIEVEISSGYAQREIGFDSSNRPILHAPTERNYGFWTDSNSIFLFNKYEVIPQVDFNKLWNDINIENAI